MIDLVKDNFIIILLVLFAGIMYWAFKTRKNIKKQNDREGL